MCLCPHRAASTCELLTKEKMRGGIVLGSQSKRRGGEGEKEGNMGLGAPWEREAQKEDLEAGNAEISHIIKDKTMLNLNLVFYTKHGRTFETK